MELSFRSLAVLFILLVWSAPADACPYCKERPKVWAGVFNEDFVATLLQVTLTIPLLIGIGLAFHLADRWPFRSSAPAGTAAVPPAPRAAPVRRGHDRNRTGRVPRRHFPPYAPPVAQPDRRTGAADGLR